MRCIHKGFPFILAVVLVMFVVCSGIGPAMAQPQPEQAMVTTIRTKVRGPLPMVEPGQREVGVRSMDIVTGSGRFHITSATKVVNQTGKLVSMNDLLVPCEARIVYQPLRHNDPNALKIEVKRILAGATKKWATQGPQ